jgi:hypothetical protein
VLAAIGAELEILAVSSATAVLTIRDDRQPAMVAQSTTALAFVVRMGPLPDGRGTETGGGAAGLITQCCM